MLPSSIRTFWSLTHAPSTPLRVWVARVTASLTASSKLVSDVALNSVTRATLIRICASLRPGLPDLFASLICGPMTETPNIKAGTQNEGYPGAVGAKNPVGTEGGMPRPDHGPPNLTSWPLNVVNERLSLFKAHP